MKCPSKRGSQGVFDAAAESALSSGKRPLLLLHACCAPCSAGVLWRAASAFRVIVFYYNPNIAPDAERERRKAELQRFLEVYPLALENGVEFVAEDASYGEWEDAVGLNLDGSLVLERERGKRCRKCCAMRLAKAKEKAAKLGAEYFATTLTLSPHKDAAVINEEGMRLSGEAGQAQYLASDFKKQNGFLKSLELSREYGLYRQKYCGCKCSMQRT